MADFPDLSPLLNIIRGIQAASSSLAPEPQPDLPNGGFSNEQAQRWMVWRNAKIQAAQVPQNVKDQMIAGEDFGEGEPIPTPQSQAVLDAKEAEARARAGRRPGTPSTTGAPPQPGRDLPLEYGLNPDNSWGFSKTPPAAPLPGVQQISAGQVARQLGDQIYRDQPNVPPTSTDAGGMNLLPQNQRVGPDQWGMRPGHMMMLLQQQQNPDGRVQQLLQQLNPTKPDDRQNPEDMFTPEQNLARNQAYAKPGPYLTALAPEQEAQFQAWVKANNVNWKPGDQDYDMRGFWLAQQQGDPRAVSKPDPNDIDPKTGQPRLHEPDIWKTPYAATFSNESRYALPNAPKWVGDQYTLPNGHVQYDDVTGRWFEQPGTARVKKDNSP